MFSEQFFEKSIDFAFKKLGPVFLLWFLGVVFLIYPPDKKVLNLDLTYSDKGLLLVFFSLICLLFHHIIGWYLARKRFYDPRYYRDDVFNDVKEALSVAGFLVQHASFPNLTSMTNDNPNAYLEKVEKAFDLSLKLPKTEHMRLYEPILRYSEQVLDSKEEDERKSIQIKMTQALSEFRNSVSWVYKK